MILSKWAIYQGLTIISLLVILFLAEFITGNINITISSEQLTPVNSGIAPFLFTGIVLGCFYLLFLFEAKKRKNLFKHPLWNKMPIITVGLGIISFVIFVMTAFFGPLFQWTEQWRFLIYAFYSYFLFLLFVFIFSLVYKNRVNGEKVEKTTHLAYLWTLGVLFVSLFFIQPI